MTDARYLRMSYMNEETAKSLNYVLGWPSKLGPMGSNQTVEEVKVRMKADGFPFCFVLDDNLPRDSQCLLAFSSTIREETDLGEWTALIHTEKAADHFLVSKMLVFARDHKTFMRLVFLNGITIDGAQGGG